MNGKQLGYLGKGFILIATGVAAWITGNKVAEKQNEPTFKSIDKRKSFLREMFTKKNYST